MIIRIMPIGVPTKDGRVVAIDADLGLPDVFPVMAADIGGYAELSGYGEHPRIQDGYLIADFTLKGIASELMNAGTHFLAAEFQFTDFEYFEETSTSVMVKGILRAVVVVSRSEDPWRD